MLPGHKKIIMISNLLYVLKVFASSFEALSIISETVSLQYLFKCSHSRSSAFTSQHLCLSMVQVSPET